MHSQRPLPHWEQDDRSLLLSFEGTLSPNVTSSLARALRFTLDGLQLAPALREQLSAAFLSVTGATEHHAGPWFLGTGSSPAPQSEYVAVGVDEEHAWAVYESVLDAVNAQRLSEWLTVLSVRTTPTPLTYDLTPLPDSGGALYRFSVSTQLARHRAAA